MKNEWILDVLADLKAFAQANGLDGLAAQLEDTALVAAVEIASGVEEARIGGEVETGQAGRYPGGVGTGFRS